MPLKQFGFDRDSFNRLFPFYFTLDRNLRLISWGKSLNKLFQLQEHLPFHEWMTPVRPQFVQFEFDELRELGKQMMILRTKQSPAIIFRGQFEWLAEPDALLFIGSPWLGSVESLHDLQLSVSDFAVHDPMFDLLHLLKAQEIANDDQKMILSDLEQQKLKLRSMISEMQELARKLEESNQRYQYVSKATSEYIWDWDILTGEVFRNEAYLEEFGVTQGSAQNVESWLEIIHPDDRERLLQSIERVLDSNEQLWSEEFRLKRVDGNYAYINDKALIVRDGHGKAIRAIGAMRDVTQSKLEEVRLKLLESVITNINDAVVITDPLPISRPGPPIIYVNQAFSKMMGYLPEEVIGKSPKILQGPLSDQAELKRLSQAMQQQESCSFTTINYKKNGELIWVQVTVSPIFAKDGSVQHWIAITRDISESKLAAEAMANQKKFHEDILNHIPSDIAVFNKQHQYLFLNPQAIKNDEIRNWLIGKDDFDYCTFRGLDTGMAVFRRERFNEVLKSNLNVEWVDEHRNSLTGEISYVLRKFHPYIEDEDLKFVIGYGLDITARRRMEIQLEEALARMEKTNEELEQFAYVASHDLQEPLRMVSSFLTQLERKYATVLDERGREYIHFAVDGALRMKQIILDLLEFSRVGRTEEKLETVAIQDVINEIIVLHAAQIQESKALVIFDQLPEINGYHAPIRQVFQNLISNSLKYQHPNVQPVIEIRAKELPQFWQFSISDNGIGISEKYHQKIFVIFQRLHTKQQYSGTGIGLAITKKIVESMGGTISVNSIEGKGATFTFTIARN